MDAVAECILQAQLMYITDRGYEAGKRICATHAILFLGLRLFIMSFLKYNKVKLLKENR